MGESQKVLGVITLCVVALLPGRLSAQDDGIQSKTLQVGVVDLEPFAMKTVDGHWEGISIDLWREVADRLGVDFELREYGSTQALTEAFVKGDVDLTPLAAVTAEREVLVDFSDAYYVSGSAIVVPAQKTGQDWVRVARRFFSVAFLQVIGLLILLWLIAGVAVWLFEGRRNREMFGGGPAKGVAQGIWWAAVTMTTVGYGDLAPKTAGGRIVGVVWMFAAIISISGFTAAISSSLTVGELSGKVRGMHDLAAARVGTVAESSAEAYLMKKGIKQVRSFGNPRDGLKSLVDAETDAFVFQGPVVKYLAKNEFLRRVEVLPGTFDHHYMGMAVPPGSQLREPLNRALLAFMETDQWTQILKQYLGQGS
ncbi:MAG: transporter substrate-binding domain-containing protein [Polyangiales bacterium]|jgi:ABC-type amino acid transport substrate-binding protein